MNRRLWLLFAFSLVATVGGIVTGWFLWPRSKFDFDKLGGTVLVYELADDPDREIHEPGELSDVMAESLRRRLDPDGRDEVTVRLVGKSRFELRIARTKVDHAEQVKQVKSLVSMNGRLEFRILANNPDDQEAIMVARALLNTDDPDRVKELEQAQLRGAPPPGPGGKDPQRFTVKLARGQKSVVTYRWVELGPHECRALNLDNAAEFDPERGAAWQEAKKARNRAIQISYPGIPHERMLQGALFFSRVCTNQNLPDEVRRTKAVDYFVLARDPEFESPDSPVRTPMIDGRYFTNALSIQGQDGRPTVSFSFNATGGDLFGALTRKNVSEDNGAEIRNRRHLAILLDGMVMSAPTINSEIRTQGQISGNFTQQEVDQLVNILRAGVLPASLKPSPVSETEVAPKEPRTK